MKNQHVGSSLDSLFEADGIKDAIHSEAAKKVLAWQIQEQMALLHLSKTEMARLMNTSRAQLDRLLDPDNSKVQLDTIEKAAKAVGRRLVLELA